jgi:hypothetical protein
MAKRRRAIVPLPFANPRAQATDVRTPGPAQACTITFAHNVQEEQVGMLFSGPVTSLAFSPEQAEHVAKQLMQEAALARGETPTG